MVDMQVFVGIYIRVESTRGNLSKQKRFYLFKAIGA